VSVVQFSNFPDSVLIVLRAVCFEPNQPHALLGFWVSVFISVGGLSLLCRLKCVSVWYYLLKKELRFIGCVNFSPKCDEMDATMIENPNSE